jgi:hypothetical protein
MTMEKNAGKEIESIIQAATAGNLERRIQVRSAILIKKWSKVRCGNIATS